MKHVMLDLETMSTRPNAAIVQIGAVGFGLPNGIGSSFSRAVSLQSCIDVGLAVDGSTIEWWLQQGDEARDAITRDQVSLTKALEEFGEWFRGHKAKFVWANSPAFDCVILRSAYLAATGGRAPFHYRQERCCRTVWAVAAGLGVEIPETKREGAAHDAAADALYQAMSMQETIGAMRDRMIG